MKKFAAMLLAAAFMLPVSAQAAEYGVYVTPKIGVAIQKMHVSIPNAPIPSSAKGTKAVFGGGLALGYDFQTQFDVPVRAELEYTLWGSAKRGKSHTAEGVTYNVHGKVGMQALFANVYYDFHNASAFTPYVGAGIGWGRVKTSGHISEEVIGAQFGSRTKNNFAWNLGLGCSYAFNDMFSLDLGYRYVSYGKGTTNHTMIAGESYHFKSKDNTQHQFMLGARFTF